LIFFSEEYKEDFLSKRANKERTNTEQSSESFKQLQKDIFKDDEEYNIDGGFVVEEGEIEEAEDILQRQILKKNTDEDENIKQQSESRGGAIREYVNEIFDSSNFKLNKFK
jgi:hypothetical protein